MSEFSQSAGDARAFAAKHRYRVDINHESVAQGVSNVGSGLVQGIPVSTSLSASSLNYPSGGKAPVASLTTGAQIILTLSIASARAVAMAASTRPQPTGFQLHPCRQSVLTS